MIKLLKIFFGLSFIFPTKGVTQSIESPDEVVVTATREETEKKLLAQSVDVITERQMKERGIVTVARALQELPGLDVVTTGGFGGNTSVFMRGANSEHTLVLIDGVEVNNPSSNNRSFNFSSLAVSGIERIEVVRGPQGVMYGSDGLGGVINIITKRARRTGGSITAEGGNYSFRRFVGEAAVRNSSSGLSLSTEGVKTTGISSARLEEGNTEKDGAANGQVTLKGDSKLGESLTLKGSILASRLNSDLDNFGGRGGDDPNRRLVSRSFFASGNLDYTVLPDRWTSQLGYGYRRHSLHDRNDADEKAPYDTLRSTYKGNFSKIYFLNFVRPHDLIKLTLGAETERERGSGTYEATSSFGPFSDPLPGQSIRTSGLFSNVTFEPTEWISLMAGGRIDDNSLFNSYKTWSLAPLIKIPSSSLRVFGTVSTGFKAPSLYQLYSQYGSSSLMPEQVKGWDIGIEQELWAKGNSIRATYFHQKYTNLISFDPQSFYFANIVNASSSGVETFFTFEIANRYSSQLSYTYTDTEDKMLGTSLLRRPRHKASARLTRGAGEKFESSLGLVFNGSRFDNDFSGSTPQTTVLSSFTLVDLNVVYRPTKAVEFSTRVANIFDKEYQPVRGYGAPGFSVVGGAKISF